MRKDFETPIIKIVKLENEGILTALSGGYSSTYFENELPIAPFSSSSDF